MIVVDTRSEIYAFATSLRTVLEQARSLTSEIEATLIVLDAHERAIRKVDKDKDNEK